MLTHGALIKLSALSGPEKLTRATVTVDREHQRLTVLLDSGKGEIVQKRKNRRLSTIRLSRAKRVSVHLPPVPSNPEVLESGPLSISQYLSPDPQEKPNPKAKQSRRVELWIDSPPNFTVTHDSQILFSGHLSSAHGQLFINKQRVIPQPNFTFSSNVPIRKGANTIIIQLVQPDGNTSFQRWIINRRH